MTTSTNTPRLTYLTSDGSTVNFTFNFDIADQNSIAVYVGTTLKTLTTDYTVAFDSGTSGTGTITLNSAPAINTRVYLIRDTYNVRSTDFAQGGAFLAQTINNELDRITQGIQDVDNIVADKVLRVAEPTVETATLTIPAAATRASKTLGFDASGNVTVLTIGSGTVDSVGLSTSDANITLGGTNPVTGTGTITVNLTNPLVKNLTGDVTGNVTAASGTSTFNNLIINGDLTVEGTTTTVNTATLDVEDNIIRLATNQSGAPSVNAGIEVERGSSADKSLIWNETTDKWTVGSETFVAGTVEANVTGNLTGNVTGNADSATFSSAVTLTADNTTNATNYLLFSNAASGNQSPRTDTGLTYNPGTNTLTGGTFSGVFSGTLTGANDFITVVGDDSTGVNVTLGETFKIAGGSNITTSVSGDTLTINGSNPAQGITFVGDDSTGTIISDGETVKIAGTQNITTAVSGDTLTITGPNLTSFITASSTDTLTNKSISLTSNTITGTTAQFNTALSDDNFATLAGSETLTNKTLTTPIISSISNTGTLTLPTSTDTLVGRATTDTLTNKSISLTSNTITGTTAQFNTALSDDNFATLAGSETLTNKTLTTPVIASITNTGTLTLPTSTDTLVGRATTDTLTNKTLTTPIISSISNTGTLTLPTSTDTLVGKATTDTLTNKSISLTSNTITGTLAEFNTALSDGDFATTSYVDSQITATNTLTIADDTSTTSSIDLDNTLQVIGGNNITTSVSGSTLTITGDKSIDVNEINSGDSSAIQINDAVNVSGATTINNTLAVTSTSRFTGDATFLGSITGDTNSPVTIAPDGTGDVHLNTDSVRIGDNNSDATIATRGTGDLILTTHEGSGTEGVIRIYDGADGNITVTPNGTGDVQLVADTVQIGDSNANATLTTNGTGDIIINTNSGTNSGSITVADGANGNIKILVNGTGKIDLVQELNATNFPFTPAVDNTNLAPYDSPTYVGSRQLYSNLTQGNITDPTERVRANTRFVAIKHPNDSTTYSDADYVIQNTDITVVDINGQSFAHTSRGASARGEANNVFMLNTAGGTKTGPNMNGGGSFVEISEGHGGDLTCSNAMGFRSLISNRADTGEFTRMTNAYGFLSEGIGTGGTGANGTNRFVTNEYGFFSQGATGTSLVTNYYGFYVNSGANATNRFGVYVNNSAYSNLLGGLTLVNNAISSAGGGTITIASAANGAITIAPNGTGTVRLDTDVVRIGDSNASANITTNGTGDLFLNTNSGTNSGSITITQGANGNITLAPNGTGDVILSADTVQVGDSAAAATITSNGAGNLILQTGSSPTGNITITQGANANISITPDGTGDVILSADTVQVGDSNSNATITTNGTGTLSLSTNNGTNSGTIQIASGANGAITIAPNGTGDVLLSADTVQIGDSNADATITTNGTGDLILNTNSGSNTGSITIADGVNGNISILNNGTGELVVSGAITTSGAKDLVLDTNAGSNSGSITIADGVNGDITVVTNGTGTVNFSDDIVRQATLKDYAETVYAIGNSGSGTITPDVTNGNVQTITATDNFTLALPSNIPTGGSLTLIITQDVTGGRTCTFDSGYKFANAFKTLTGTASSIDVVVIFYTGSVYLASLNINFS
jgi:hypothetical protein